jgi:hypothetical protein
MLTPKVFPNFDDPSPRVREFFDHYRPLFRLADRVVIAFAAGNGDHILNYPGREGWSATFDWARYNCFVPGGDAARMRHNYDWLIRAREGGEHSYNPFMAGPMFIVSEQVMNYEVLKRIYDAFRIEAQVRGIDLQILEYLEPGPEFCACEWKTVRHPEGAQGNADAGGHVVQGVIDVTSHLKADAQPYAAYPKGIPGGTNTGEFVINQIDAYTRDFELDGVFLGNQFGLIGFWHPDNAPPATPARRDGIKRFFHDLRRKLGQRTIYWMDTYWPADMEIEKWSMSEENYAQLDAVMMSNFAVIVERTQVVPNLESRLRIAQKFGGRPDTMFSFDFVDPWYWYRTYLDDRKNFLFQHDVFRKHGHRTQGMWFFANDTFGHWVMPGPLGETSRVIAEALGKAVEE